MCDVLFKGHNDTWDVLSRDVSTVRNFALRRIVTLCFEPWSLCSCMHPAAYLFSQYVGSFALIMPVCAFFEVYS
jgi:hypothetical protein